MDNLTIKQRKKCMSNIRNKDTKPEYTVRQALTKRRLRYRLHVGKLPGKPDIAISRMKKTIFINGCFWHQHNGCKKIAMPKTNKDYWGPKLKRNIKKQKQDIKKLNELNWKSYVIWECETKNKGDLEKKIVKILS